MIVVCDYFLFNFFFPTSEINEMTKLDFISFRTIEPYGCSNNKLMPDNCELITTLTGEQSTHGICLFHVGIW